jgi:hypothetical protein
MTPSAKLRFSSANSRAFPAAEPDLSPPVGNAEKAAEHWASKNPLEAYSNIIRVWGVLNFYRPPRQTSWSKALVRHGADARLALAAVLGLPAEDIRVREP